MNNEFLEEQEIIIMVGLPRSGKSTYVRETYGNRYKYKIYELDEYRLKITGKIYEEDAEPYVWDEVRSLIAEDIIGGYSIVIDECNPLIGNIRFWSHLKKINNIKCKVIKFNTNKDICIGRVNDNNKYLIDVINRKDGVMDTIDTIKQFCKNNNIDFILIDNG